MIRVLITSAVILSAGSAAAQTCTPRLLYPPNRGDVVGVTCSENVIACTGGVTEAAAMWNGCSGSGTTLPTIAANSGGDVAVLDGQHAPTAIRVLRQPQKNQRRGEPEAVKTVRQ